MGDSDAKQLENGMYTRGEKVFWFPFPNVSVSIGMIDLRVAEVLSYHDDMVEVRFPSGGSSTLSATHVARTAGEFQEKLLRLARRQYEDEVSAAKRRHDEIVEAIVDAIEHHEDPRSR